MEGKPDTIKITAVQREQVFASHAELDVTVKGVSFVSGNEARKKAREVSQLVDAMIALGLDEDAVQLLGVQLESGGAGPIRSSSAVYRLRVRCEKLEQLPGLLDIIAAQKNAALERVEWKYPEEAARARGLEAAIAKGKVKAEKVAAALGVRLLGIYDFIENAYDEEARVPFPARALEMQARASAEQPGLDVEIQHSKNLHVAVDIWYRVSAF
jgi:uncharacterized protein YggE